MWGITGNALGWGYQHWWDNGKLLKRPRTITEAPHLPKCPRCLELYRVCIAEADLLGDGSSNTLAEDG